MISEELRQILGTHNWEASRKRLIVYAHKKLISLFWRGERGGPVPGGKEAEDFAMQAICDVYSGKRHWDPAKHPDLQGYLYDVVDSLVSNVITHAENQVYRVDSIVSVGDSLPGSPDPMDEVADDMFVCEFIDELADDPPLQRVVEAVMDGHMKRGDIAEHLSISPEEVTNLRKRLERRLTAYNEKVGGTQGRTVRTFEGEKRNA